MTKSDTSWPGTRHELTVLLPHERDIRPLLIFGPRRIEKEEIDILEIIYSRY